MITEGGELEVLKGRAQTIKKYKPIIAIELIESQLNQFNNDKASVMKWLENIGYTNIIPLRFNENIKDDRVDVVCFHEEYK